MSNISGGACPRTPLAYECQLLQAPHFRTRAPRSPHEKLYWLYSQIQPRYLEDNLRAESPLAGYPEVVLNYTEFLLVLLLIFINGLLARRDGKRQKIPVGEVSLPQASGRVQFIHLLASDWTTAGSGQVNHCFFFFRLRAQVQRDRRHGGSASEGRWPERLQYSQQLHAPTRGGGLWPPGRRAMPAGYQEDARGRWWYAGRDAPPPGLLPWLPWRVYGFAGSRGFGGSAHNQWLDGVALRRFQCGLDNRGAAAEVRWAPDRPTTAQGISACHVYLHRSGANTVLIMVIGPSPIRSQVIQVITN